MAHGAIELFTARLAGARGPGRSAESVPLQLRLAEASAEVDAARAVLDAEPMQRFHRDVHSASHHAALSWDAVAENYGRHARGLGPISPL